MQVNEAKAAARRWVLAEARKVPGYSGAFFHGSTNWLAGDAMLAATSDLDVMVVLDDTDVPAKPGKVMAEQVMLDVTYISRDELSSAEQILKLSHLAGSFHAPGIIDPTGQLTALQQAVAVEYPTGAGFVPAASTPPASSSSTSRASTRPRRSIIRSCPGCSGRV